MFCFIIETLSVFPDFYEGEQKLQCCWSEATAIFFLCHSEWQLVLVPSHHRALFSSSSPELGYSQLFSSYPFHVALLMHPSLWFTSVFSSFAPQAIFISTKSWPVTLPWLLVMKSALGEENEHRGLKQMEIHIGIPWDCQICSTSNSRDEGEMLYCAVPPRLCNG